jgi:hypothetical protein
LAKNTGIKVSAFIESLPLAGTYDAFIKNEAAIELQLNGIHDSFFAAINKILASQIDLLEGDAASTLLLVTLARAIVDLTNPFWRSWSER